MATGVNVKMGVSGVQQFKQGMKESQAAVKTLDQALKLNEQQLKSTGDAELYLQNKTQILQDQIAKQTEVVKQSQAALDAMRRNGVAETSTAFQQMQQQVYKASTDLMRMQSDLENVGQAGEDAATGANDLDNSLKDIGRGVSWDNVTNGIEKITGTLENAAKAALRMGRAIVSATLEGGQWADNLQTEADKWEIEPEQLYRMQQTANQIDTDAETILQARKRLTAAMGKEGNANTMGAFAALGIDPNARHDDIEGVFWEAGEALMGMDDKVNRNEYAMQLFGRSFEDLIPLFKTGREEYESTMESFSWVGDKQFESLKKADDASNKLNSEWEVMKRTFEGTMAEVMTPVMETLTGLLQEFNTYLQSDEGQQMLQDLGDTIKTLFEDLQTIDPETVINGIKDAINGVKDALNWIKNNKDTIKKAIEGIALAWAGMKLGGLALNVGKIVSGFKQLGWLGGGGAAAPAAPTAAPAAGGSATTIGGSGLLGIGGAAAIVAGFNWAQDRRLNHADQVRGTDEHLLAQSSGAEAELVNYLHAMQAQSKLTWTESDAEIAAVVAAVEESRNRLMGTEGGQAALDAYSDWRQENSYGNDYWEVPEYLDKMTTVAGETNEAVTQSTAASTQMTEALKGFESVPADLQKAVESAVISGMASVTIVINEGAVDTIGRRTLGGGGRNVVALTR